MKTLHFSILLAVVSISLSVHGQGTTFVYDQQSATNRTLGPQAAPIQEDQPMGQSFTPSMAGVGFVQFEFLDFHPTNGLGATVFVNLLADSISGNILGSTAPVFMPDGFNFGITNFFFPTTITLTPGTTYYLQPVAQSGDDPWDIINGNFGYAGGTFYVGGAPHPDDLDLWFREGVVAPEPSSALLILIGAGVLTYVRRRHIRMRSLA